MAVHLHNRLLLHLLERVDLDASIRRSTADVLQALAASKQGVLLLLLLLLSQCPA
jgi:hypothetical protein